MIFELNSEYEMRHNLNLIISSDRSFYNGGKIMFDLLSVNYNAYGYSLHFSNLNDSYYHRLNVLITHEGIFENDCGVSV